MNEHERWKDRLSEVVDGTLEPAERRAAEAHLARCAGCRAVVTDLRALVERAGELGDVPPTRDLWPGIEARLDPREAEVIPLVASGSGVAGGGAGPAPGEAAADPAPGATRGPPRGLFLSLPQMAAAAVLLALASSLITLAANSGPGTSAAPEAAAPSAVRPVGGSAGAPPELAGELEALGAVVAEAGERLDPETLRVIERNLAVIEGAIEDSRRALAQDPSNEFLRAHLDRAWERKLSYLQQAAGIVEWASS